MSNLVNGGGHADARCLRNNHTWERMPIKADSNSTLSDEPTNCLIDLVP